MFVISNPNQCTRMLSPKQAKYAAKLFDKIKSYSLDNVHNLLTQYNDKYNDNQLVNVSQVDQENVFPLFLASAMGDVEMMRLLVDWGANVFAETDFGHSALHAAAFYGNPQAVDLLIRLGFDEFNMNRKNLDGETLLDELLDDIQYRMRHHGKTRKQIPLLYTRDCSPKSMQPVLESTYLLITSGAKPSKTACIAFLSFVSKNHGRLYETESDATTTLSMIYEHLHCNVTDIVMISSSGDDGEFR